MANLQARTNLGVPRMWSPEDTDVAGALSHPSTDRSTGFLETYGQKYPSRDMLDAIADNLEAPDNWTRVATAGSLFGDAQTLLRNRLQRGLVRLIPSGIPPAGGLIYYTDNLERCQIYSYEMPPGSVGAVKVKPTGEVVEPRVLLDIGAGLYGFTVADLDGLKRALVLGHKIVGHRNTFVHVDRRRGNVDGPFIDTLVLNELIHKYFVEFMTADISRRPLFQTVCEIGSGSGMLLASVVQHCRGIHRAVAVDISMAAVQCTHSNVLANPPLTARAPGSEIPLDLYCACGRFGGNMPVTCDLVLCNPPYIPRWSGATSDGTGSSGLYGTEVLEQVVVSSPNFLSDQGILLMVVGAGSDRELRTAATKAGLDVHPFGAVEGFTATFDQAEVVGNKSWLDEMEAQQRIRRRAASPGVYEHAVKCFALWRRGALDHEFVAAQRVLDLNARLEG